jgi:ankyrin repeat protein
VLRRQPDVVASLLRHGANADKSDDGDLTAFVLAVLTKQVEIARMLLGAGADPGVWYHGFPLLTHLVTSTIEDETAVALIDLMAAHGADLDVRDDAGRLTPLMRAARGGRARLVRALLRAGAKPNLVSNGCRYLPAFTALTWAFEERINGYGRDAAAYKSTAEALVEAGARSDLGFNPLMLAAHGGQSKWVRLALRYGLPVNHALPDGRTALHLAAANGYGAVVRVLLAAGADPTLRDAEGRTALDAALRRSPSAYCGVKPDFDAAILALGGDAGRAE